MVDINPDHIFEVPDTPDRIQQSTCPVSSPAARRGITKAAGNPFPPRRIRFKIPNSSIHGQSSRDNASSVPPAPLDAGDIFKQAELARLLPVEDPEARSTSLKSGRTIGTSAETGKGPEKLGLEQSRNISNNINSRCQIRKEELSSRDANRNNAGFLGVGSGIPTTVGEPRNRMGTITFNKLKEVVGADVCSVSSFREDKGEETTDKGTTGLSSSTLSIVPRRHVGQRKLVRNGCISPSNIAKRSLKVDEKREMCSTSRLLRYPDNEVDVFEKGNVIDLTDNSPAIRRQGNTSTDMEKRSGRKLAIPRAGEAVIPLAANQVNSSIFSEGSNSKGKEISHDGMSGKQSGEAYIRRVCPRSMGDSSSVANNDHTGIYSEHCWRTTHNNTSILPMSLSGDNNNSINGADNNNSIDGATTLQTATVNKTIRISNRKRKHIPSSYHPAESSSSLDQPRVASLGSTSARNRITHRCHIPVVDIDDICSPEVRSTSSGIDGSNQTLVDPNIREQLESDELLARQLQEQLYNETPHVVPAEEIDAIIAMSLQNEENAQQTSRATRRFQNTTRGTRVMRSSASQHANRVVYDSANRRTIYQRVLSRYPAAHIQPNIDLNDYDALLALDENNHQHAGASESQINNLPQSVVQSNNIEEPCAVCLENPSIGDTIRRLPCFHMFHKECIDEWLRRKKLCPVCKSGIT
ncbi:E3 ubiquitin-protein ligase RNF12-A-like isoform X2 [Oryza brachyantha]|uniref:RING-type domain-containing protein n=1 Tax=Oryza brachyantha TaxID=4533 RepID=J3LZI3_ORYBR|nr:E3 ubiquitin-protein ligase RNF12-A-like isoform X2 [Oryza brachyantha]